MVGDTFDPYHQWLSIPPEEQPPNHYRLLGIKLFEEKPNVIESAADRQMAHLRTFQAGKHGALSQRLLNEVAAARIGLLNPQKRAAYDQRLRRELQARETAEPTPSSGSLDSDLVEALRQAESRKVGAPARPKNLGVLVGIGVVVVAVGAGLVLWLSRPRARPATVAAGKGPVSTAPAPVEKPEKLFQPPALPAQPEPEKPSPKPVEPAPTQPEGKGAAPSVPAPEPKPAKPKPGTTQSPAKPPSDFLLPTSELKKLPVPDAAALEKARNAADALFNAEIEKAKTPADKVALAKRLLLQALDQPGAADRYALMVMAQDLAIAAKNAETTFQAVDQLAEAFDADRFVMKTEILEGWAKDARTPDARKSLAEQVLVVGGEALDAGDLEAAKELRKLATSKSSGLRDKDLRQKLKDYNQRLGEVAKDSEELKTAQAILAKDPKDPQASLVVGRYSCFTKGDWKKGLPLLAQGSDEALQQLATRELTSPPAQPDDQIALADAWWQIALKRRPSQMSSIKIHAGQWYRRAAPALPPGLVKEKVEKRLAEVAKLRSRLPAPPLAVAPFDEKQAKEHQQRWAEYLGERVEMTNSIGMKFVLIPPGEFDMGSTPEQIAQATEYGKQHPYFSKDQRYFDQVLAEGPRHHVKISKPFYFGVHEVTQEEYQHVVGNNPSSFSANGKLKDKVAGQNTSRHPVETVSWEGAMEYCRRLSALPQERAAGRMYRLPTEAEWEYACRAGSTTLWAIPEGADTEAKAIHDYAWNRSSSGVMTHPVGQKKPVPWGLYDTYGNVAEWCLDWYAPDYYRESPPVDPGGPAFGQDRVNRGGNYGDTSWGVRCAIRGSMERKYPHGWLGFRVVCVRDAK